MNNKFDELTKSLPQSATRRVALKRFGVGLAATALRKSVLVSLSVVKLLHDPAKQGVIRTHRLSNRLASAVTMPATASIIAYFRKILVPVIIVSAVAGGSPLQAISGSAESNRGLADAMESQGVGSERILGFDSKGIPILCGNCSRIEAPSRPSAADGPTDGTLPSGTRSWEAIPSVIRNNDADTFRLEVDANGPVAAVYLDLNNFIVSSSGVKTQALRDDGLGGDRVAGDYVFTSGPLMYTNLFPFGNIGNDTNSPFGLMFQYVGYVRIVELNGDTNEFLITPAVGVLHTNVPLSPTMALSSDILVAPYLVNVKGTNRETQKFLRSFPGDLSSLTKQLYGVLADSFDFLTFFSIDHIERIPYISGPNFIAGVHGHAKVNYSGTGLTEFTNTLSYGSQSTLLGFNALDTSFRGIHSGNATHELVHDWASFTDTSLGLSDGTAHYTFRSDAASLVGGFMWVATGHGSHQTFTQNCDEGRGGAHHAPPIDKYMMGLIDGSAVPPLHIYSTNGPTIPCGGVISNVATVVTIAEIQGLHGIRAPGPAQAERNFTIAFVAESNGRLLNPTEMTFYNALAAHYTKPVPPEYSDPYVRDGWVSIARFFGENTSWRSDLASVITPKFLSILRLPNGSFQMTGQGFSGLSYSLQNSSDTTAWTTVGMITVQTNGTFSFADNSARSASRFYRLSWP